MVEWRSVADGLPEVGAAWNGRDYVAVVWEGPYQRVTAESSMFLRNAAMMDDHELARQHMRRPLLWLPLPALPEVGE